MENVILVAQKEIAKYIWAILRNTTCVLKSRGANMKRAIDCALIAKRDYGYEIEKTEIYNETMQTDTGEVRHISAIDIYLEK